MAAAAARPNIRIEIQNNLMEPMEVDEDEVPANSDFEDGEISDKNDVEFLDPAYVKHTLNRMWTYSSSGFTTGVDIFDKKEQEKLQERANRFGLKPDEINNFTDEHLQRLHNSLGINREVEKNVRFEAIHMRGTDDMSTEDVFEYFGKYGPAYIEWISDESCNVVWNDKISAARALHFISKPIKGMPVKGPCNPFKEELEDEQKEENVGRSVLLVNKDREVSLEKDDSEMSGNAKEENADEFVNTSDVKIPIPPGYWRLGVAHPKTKYVLLRFAYKTDKKPMRAERFSEYYKKHGNPNFGGLKGLISESRRKRVKGIFDRNKEIAQLPANGKNPWGQLAEEWDLDDRFAEKVYSKSDPPTKTSSDKLDIMKRLGTKRSHSIEAEVDDAKESTKISKVPRMRMYADEEEEKQKRKKQLLSMKMQQNVLVEDNKVQDLRNFLGATTKNKKIEHQEQEHQGESSTASKDLGLKLKNRTRTEELSYSRYRADSLKASKREEAKSNIKKSSASNEYHRHKRHQRDSSSHSRDYSKSRYENKLHSNKYVGNDVVDRSKPKSKVAVVIKTQKRPAVASTIWSRINPQKERLKTASERQRPRRDSSSSSDSFSTDSGSTSSESTSSDTSSDSDEESAAEEPMPVVAVKVERPGFTTSAEPPLSIARNKSPLRIEISNDHFKEE